MVIKLFFNNVFVKISNRKKLKRFIVNLFEKYGTPLSSLTYIFCSDNYLLSINNEFLGHNEYTDIITFTLSHPFKPIEGEVYISIERVKENAKKLDINANRELHRVIFHGALHLCGYNDKTPLDKQRMTTAENKYLKEYFGN